MNIISISVELLRRFHRFVQL